MYQIAVTALVVVLWAPVSWSWLSWQRAPPLLVVFGNSSGAALHCAAADRPATTVRAAPTVAPLSPATVSVTWLDSDGMPLLQLPGIRSVYENGSLVFHRFPAHQWSAHAHAGSYRCRAAVPTAPERGLILSTPVRVQAVVESWWSVSVEVVAAGRLLRCGEEGDGLRAGEREGRIAVSGWYRDQRLIADTDEEASVSSDGWYLALWSEGAGRYHCEATHLLTGDTRRSDAVTVNSADAEGGPPRVVHAGAVRAMAGRAARLLCAAAGSGPLAYSWLPPAAPPGPPLPPARSPRGALLLSPARPLHAGRWRCSAANALGETSADILLTVEEPLIVTVHPKLHVADAGSEVSFTCSARGGAGSLRWLHDGRPLGGGRPLEGGRWQEARVLDGGRRLVVTGGRASRGHYQCEALRGADVATDSAELSLGESPPELVYTFIEQAVLAESAVSLWCRAAGTPLPAVHWLLDGQPIEHLDAPHRSVSQWSPAPDVVESRLNLSLARPADGGRYACRATNQRGSVEHAARLNVYGPPAVRSVPPLRVVAGVNTTIHCPYSGFPISEISWVRGGQAVGRSGRVSASSSGSLRLLPADATDAGLYTCRVRAPHSHFAQNDLQIIVKIPPKISGFFFPTDLVEGSSVQVLCGITSGDKPVYFSWLKDLHPIPPSLQVKEKSQDEFSFLIFSHLTSQHSGDYTCIVTNSAAEVSHTAKLAVKVAPSWEMEPRDTSVLLGSEVVIHCATRGHPTPTVEWLKEQESAGDDFRPVTDLDLQLTTLDNGTLVISSAGKYHEGRYKCQANNGIGGGLSKTITVTVNEPAQLEFSTRNVTVKSGAPVSLSCDARGDPPIAVLWTHNSKRLDLSTYRVTVSEKRSPVGVQSALSVAAAQREDAGAYRCRAENAFGRDEMIVYLTVQEYPSAVVGLTTVWRGSRGARLRWKAGGGLSANYPGGPSYGGGPSTGYRLQQRALPSPPALPSPSDWLHTPHVHLPAHTLTHIPEPSRPGSMLVEYHLESLRPGTAYALRVAAVNEVGVSPYCPPVILRTLEEAPSEPPRNVEVQALVPGELSVKWKESWNGELLGYAVWWRVIDESDQHQRDGADGMVCGVRGWGSSAASVAPLRAGARYELRVRAFNGQGLGPPSAPLTATALGGVPSAAPMYIRCVALSPQSLRVWWEPMVQGALTGYDVIFHEADAASPESAPQSRRALSPETSLSALRRGLNYSIAVRAVTAQGPGPLSTPVHCATPEDVPSAPVELKAAPDSESAVALSWLPPVDPNGRIKHYTVYYRPQRSGAPLSLSVPAAPHGQTWSVVRGLRAAPHELWVTASTSAGEGSASAVIVTTPMHRAPAKIISSSQVFPAVVGSVVTLPCVSAGSPPPLRQWMRRRPERPIAEDKRFLIDGPNLVIRSLDVELADNYTCIARNPWGSDRVSLSVVALSLPPSPALRLLHATRSSLRLSWEHSRSDSYHTASLTGYMLEYSMSGSASWSALLVPPSAREHEVSGLACGAQYRVRVTALSAAGPSPAGPEISVATSGGKSKPPPAEELLTANSTCVRVLVLLWDSAGCGVAGWEVAVRRAGGAGAWSARPVPAGGVASHCGLQPAAWYQLRLTPHSPARPAPALYHFSTLTVDGERIPTLSPSSEVVAAPRLAALVAAGALLAATALAAAVWRQRGCGCVHPPATLPAARKAGECERPRSCQQLYSSAPGKLPVDNQDLYEISPYATFSMPPGAPASVPTPLRAPSVPLPNSTPGKHRSPLNPEEYTLSRALTLPVRDCGTGSESESSAEGQCRACSRPRASNDGSVRAVTDSSTESASVEPRGGERRRRKRATARQPSRADHERRDFTIHV